MTTGVHVTIFRRAHVTSLTMTVSTIRFLNEIIFILQEKDLILKCHDNNQNLQSWSFHKKFMKLAKDSFRRFHINDPSCSILYLFLRERYTSKVYSSF